jgi:hypothetical protein
VVPISEGHKSFRGLLHTTAGGLLQSLRRQWDPLQTTEGLPTRGSRCSVGEQLRPHLSFLLGLSDLLGQTGAYCGTWVREFYSSLWIDPAHQFIHFAFRGHDRRLYSTRVREILRIPTSETRIHQLCFGYPPGGTVPPTNLVRPCFHEPFGEGSRRTPSMMTPIATVLDAIVRRTLLLRSGYREGLTSMQLWVVHHLVSQTPFDIWDLMLCEMEDTLAEASRVTASCPMPIGFVF